jgi:hypothetical protein
MPQFLYSARIKKLFYSLTLVVGVALIATSHLFNNLTAPSLPCEPFLPTRDQYSVYIDNESYPKRVSPLHNTSIRDVYLLSICLVEW